MGDGTGIEWTDATWNPTTGCTKVSAGCDNCYAERLANRLLEDNYRRKLPVVETEENKRDPFAVRIWPDRLDIPRSWGQPKRIFVNSMSDLFHKEIPDVYVRRCFEVMLDVDRHVYQILTKRPARAASFVNDKHADLFGPNGLPGHIWIGTSVEDQSVDYRIRHLSDVEASVRFLSCEPLIGSLKLDGTGFRKGIDWVIVGGESGPGYRPMEPEWVRSIQRECEDAGVAFFFKQWGGRTPKSNGRELDGREWNEMPQSFREAGGSEARAANVASS